MRFLGSNWQHIIIGSDNGLALNRRQAIIWSNNVLVTDAYMRHKASLSFVAIDLNNSLKINIMAGELRRNGAHMNVNLKLTV